MYLLDANVVIHFFKSKGNVSQNLLSKKKSELAIPSIVQYELLFGARNQTNIKKAAILQDFLADIRIIAFTEVEAEASADIRAHLEKQGLQIGPLDNLIAGTAIANSAILVTNNIREYQRVPNLMVEDWY